METKYPYLVERCDTLVQLDNLQKEWTDLIVCIPDTPVFLTWEWIRTWWLYFGKGRELWLLTARDAQGHLVGIAPLMKELHRVGWMNFWIVTFIGTGQEIEVHNNFLTHTSDKEGISEALLNFLMNDSHQWDVISFSSVSSESPLYDLFPMMGGHYRKGAKRVSVYVPLPDNWETYQKTLTKKLRRNLKYFRSKLEADYPDTVVFACITDPWEIPCAMQRLIELNKKRWHAKERSQQL